MRLVTVGTGTVVPDPERASSCHWVEQADTRIVLDCGAGGLQGLARAGLAWGAVGHVVISHFHADHIGEIPSLIFALRHGLAEPRTEPLQIWGPAGTTDLFERWAVALGSWLTAPGFEVAIREIPPGRRLRVGDLEIDALSTPHTEESLALKLAGGESVLGYTGDTGPGSDLAQFFSDVDLLLAECSLPDALVADNHLSPTRLAKLAAEAGVERLLVTHVYPQLQRLDVVGMIRAAGYAGEILVASDGFEVQV